MDDFSIIDSCDGPDPSANSFLGKRVSKLSIVAAILLALVGLRAAGVIRAEWFRLKLSQQIEQSELKVTRTAPKTSETMTTVDGKVRYFTLKNEGPTETRRESITRSTNDTKISRYNFGFGTPSFANRADSLVETVQSAASKVVGTSLDVRVTEYEASGLWRTPLYKAGKVEYRIEITSDRDGNIQMSPHGVIDFEATGLSTAADVEKAIFDAIAAHVAETLKKQFKK